MGSECDTAEVGVPPGEEDIPFAHSEFCTHERRRTAPTPNRKTSTLQVVKSNVCGIVLVCRFDSFRDMLNKFAEGIDEENAPTSRLGFGGPADNHARLHR